MGKKAGRSFWVPGLQKPAYIMIGIYVILVASFYFLAGDQLHLRQSRGNLDMPEAESGTVELVQGAVVEQKFSCEIQRLQRVNVQWGAFYRVNSGTVTMELYNLQNRALLLSQSYDAAGITEGGILSMTAPEPIEGLFKAPLLLRIYADSQPGSAASPLMSWSKQGDDGFMLSLNGQASDGTLCFSASGEDYIWTGLHYWQFAAVGLAGLLAALGTVQYRVRQGKHSYVVNALAAVQKYRFLIRQLVSRDFKTKYKRSVLGMFWSFLNPLLTMCVQYVVFSTIFRSDIPNYAVYLLVGIVSFNFFSEACGMALTSIVGNAGLITKVYMPKYIYPLTRVMSSVVNLGISLIPLVLVALATGVRFQKSAILAFYFWMCLIIFSLGLGLLLSAAMVFFRDTQFLWGVMTMIWMYATPIFYPESILPEEFRFMLNINPIYHFLRNTRICILDGISPEPAVYFYCLLMAACMLVVGAWVFRRSQDRFVLYL